MSNEDECDDRVRELMRYQNTIEQGTQEWLDSRGEMLTASIVPSILGQNPYDRTGKYAFQAKVGLKSNSFSSPAIEWGHRYEDEAIRKYEKKTGRVALQNFPCIRHPVYPWIGASPDFITTCGVLGEVKCPFKRQITPEVPEHYYAQLQLLMEVTNLNTCHFVQYRPKNNVEGTPMELEITIVPREQGWFKRVLPSLERFWKQVLEYRTSGTIPPEYQDTPRVTLDMTDVSSNVRQVRGNTTSECDLTLYK